MSKVSPSPYNFSLPFGRFYSLANIDKEHLDTSTEILGFD